MEIMLSRIASSAFVRLAGSVRDAISMSAIYFRLYSWHGIKSGFKCKIKNECNFFSVELLTTTGPHLSSWIGKDLLINPPCFHKKIWYS